MQVSPNRRSQLLLGLLSACGTPALAQPTLAFSTFDADDQGWSIRTVNQACTPDSLITISHTWESTGGNPDGYIQHVDNADGRTAYWNAPASYLGDISLAYGGTLSFDLRQSSTSSQYVAADLYLEGGGLTLVFDTPYNPNTGWTRYHVLLHEAAGWRVGSCSGPVATQAEIQQVLASATLLLIRAEYRSGADTDGLDNVRLQGPGPGLARSTFDTGTDGWWSFGDTQSISWDPTGGNPDGCMRGDDAATGDLYGFLAPGKFLGDQTSALGGWLQFDLKASPALNDNDLLDPLNTDFVVVEGSGISLSYTLPPGPIVGNVWRRHVIPLAPGPNWTLRGTTTLATQSDFDTVFAGITTLRFRAEFRSGDEVEWLDNVLMGGCEADLSGASDPNDPAYGIPNGFTDASDFFYYLDQFVAGNLGIADLSSSPDPNDPGYGVPDGVIDASDFFYYLDLFVAGCP